MSSGKQYDRTECITGTVHMPSRLGRLPWALLLAYFLAHPLFASENSTTFYLFYSMTQWHIKITTLRGGRDETDCTSWNFFVFVFLSVVFIFVLVSFVIFFIKFVLMTGSSQLSTEERICSMALRFEVMALFAGVTLRMFVSFTFNSVYPIHILSYKYILRSTLFIKQRRMLHLSGRERGDKVADSHFSIA